MDLHCIFEIQNDSSITRQTKYYHHWNFELNKPFYLTVPVGLLHGWKRGNFQEPMLTRKNKTKKQRWKVFYPTQIHVHNMQSCIWILPFAFASCKNLAHYIPLHEQISSCVQGDLIFRQISLLYADPGSPNVACCCDCHNWISWEFSLDSVIHFMCKSWWVNHNSPDLIPYHD